MSETKHCEDCGCRVYALGCVNCNEDAYIDEQRYELGMPSLQEARDAARTRAPADATPAREGEKVEAPEFNVPDDGLTDWQRDCMQWRGKVLTGARSHWCFEWDELPVDETCDEWPCGCVIEPSAPAPRVDEVIEKLDRARAVMICALDALESDAADVDARREAFEMIQEQFEGVSYADYMRADKLIALLRGEKGTP